MNKKEKGPCSAATETRANGKILYRHYNTRNAKKQEIKETIKDLFGLACIIITGICLWFGLVFIGG